MIKTSGFDIFGIGAALYDLQYQVSDELFERMKIKKGLRTLMGRARRDALLKYLQETKCRSEYKGGGGSVANALFAARSLGASAYFCGKVADDQYGQKYIDDLTKHGITVNPNAKYTHDRRGVTGQCVAMITNDAERTMLSHLGVSHQYEKQDIDDQTIRSSKIVLVEGYLLGDKSSSDVCFSLLKRAKELDKFVVLALSDKRLIKDNLGLFLQFIQEGVDLVIGNIHEAITLTDSDNASAAIITLKSLVENAAITMGEEGAVVHHGLYTHFLAAYESKCVNTVGAGDAFAGSFLYGLAQNMRWKDAITLANAAASQVVSQDGPRLDQKLAEEIKIGF